MNKNTEDLEDIIKLLVDILENKNISREYIRMQLREYHYCFDCMQHFNRCSCDCNSSSSSECLSDYTSSNDEDYNS